MRNILVNHAIRKNRLKHGGNRQKLPLNESVIVRDGDDDLIALNEALLRLASIDQQQAQIVELKFFGNLTIHEIAKNLGISTATVQREWRMASGWLYHQMNTASAVPQHDALRQIDSNG